MNTKTKITIFVTTVILILLSIFTTNSVQRNDESQDTFFHIENGQLIDFSAFDTQGNRVTYQDVAGKHLIINSWASWCPFCLDELPDFKTVQDEFGESITIIAINRKESIGVAERFLDKTNTSGAFITLLDPNDSFYTAINGFSMPETIFVSPTGKIEIHKRGVMPLEEIQEKIKSLIP